MSVALDYDDVNEIVNDLFFGGRFGAAPVYLDLEEQLLDELAARMGLDKTQSVTALSAAVADTLQWKNPKNIYAAHTECRKVWQEADTSTAPPFTALLLCLSIAAARMREDQEFAANNYYRRLLEILGVSSAQTESALGALRSSATETAKFWESLNGWLIKTDYAFGQPTATSYASNTRYVSYAVSQSLVREVDRRHLREMLMQHGLSRKDPMSVHEMTMYIDSWMATAGPTQALRRVWGRKDQGARARVAEIALDELDTIDDARAEIKEVRSQTRRLVWLLIERDAFPRIQLRLYLATSAGELAYGELKMDGANGAEPVAGLSFSRLGVTDLHYLGPAGKLNLDRLMLTSVAVTDGRGQVFSHDAKPILMFYRPEDATYLQECPHALAFTRHVIICHESWHHRVRAHLQRYAASGFSELPGTAAGVPPKGWVAFRDVLLSPTPDEDVADDLQVLVPLRTGEVFNYTAGLKLARNIWHTNAPPEVRLDTTSALEAVELREGGAKVFDMPATDYTPRFLQRDLFERDGRNFTIIARCEAGSAPTAISFRSADSPRWLGPESEDFLAYSMAAEAGAAWGNGATREKGSRWVAGLTIAGIERPPAPLKDLASVARISQSYADIPDVDSYDATPADIDAHACIVRRHHYFIVRGKVSMRCKDCNYFVWVKEYQKAWRRETKAKSVTVKATGPVSLSVPDKHRPPTQIKPPPPIPYDVIYDAVTYKGYGTWDALSRLLSVSAAEPIDVVNSYRALVDLGLIDVEMNASYARPLRWSVPPPSLCLMDSGQMFLGGYRSNRLIGRISEILKGFDYQHAVEAQASAPSIHYWSGGELSAADIEELTSEITDPFGRRVSVTEFCADRIAGSMPYLSALVQSLPVVHIEHSARVETFQPADGRWVAGMLEAPGAYRTQMHGTTYFYYDGTKCYQTGYELAKLLAARDKKVYLHSYDVGAAAFEAMIGCEPPGLFRRALVACSGKLPSKGHGKTIYGGVGKRTANLILERLYG